jgi:hypothetical protein
MHNDDDWSRLWYSCKQVTSHFYWEGPDIYSHDHLGNSSTHISSLRLPREIAGAKLIRRGLSPHTVIASKTLDSRSRVLKNAMFIVIC